MKNAYAIRFGVLFTLLFTLFKQGPLSSEAPDSSEMATVREKIIYFFQKMFFDKFMHQKDTKRFAFSVHIYSYPSCLLFLFGHSVKNSVLCEAITKSPRFKIEKTTFHSYADTMTSLSCE